MKYEVTYDDSQPWVRVQRPDGTISSIPGHVVSESPQHAPAEPDESPERRLVPLDPSPVRAWSERLTNEDGPSVHVMLDAIGHNFTAAVAGQIRAERERDELRAAQSGVVRPCGGFYDTDEGRHIHCSMRYGHEHGCDDIAPESPLEAEPLTLGDARERVMLAENRAVMAERERDEARASLDAARVARDTWHERHNDVMGQRDELRADRNRAIAECERLRDHFGEHEHSSYRAGKADAYNNMAAVLRGKAEDA